MCYASTTYYLTCGCYRKRMPVGEPCGRVSTSQSGHSSGCWDKVDMGVESVNGICPRCTVGKTFGMTSSRSGRLMFPASPPDGRSTSECARLLLACLPPSVRNGQSEGSLSSTSSESDLSRTNSNTGSETGTGRSHQSRNLHWRAYDSGRYSDS